LIFVIDQIDPDTKRFDEHKAMFGFDTKQEAKDAYLANYEDGWKGLGEITGLTLDQFKAWLADGSQLRPLASQVWQSKRAATLVCGNGRVVSAAIEDPAKMVGSPKSPVGSA